MAENPDRIIDARLTRLPHCAQALGAADQPEVHAYDHIDLPPIKPIITRINRYHGIVRAAAGMLVPPTLRLSAGISSGQSFVRILPSPGDIQASAEVLVEIASGSSVWRP
ncbi:hypothetical protein [Acidiphilium acidophilum]|uniref:hypothetical protein n=1 Tax=Acidiphilium acidophilum TaxID=76588 RepID=UPI002E8E795D|nr:hypothetical protein [Acidiphilium acidophilum]